MRAEAFFLAAPDGQRYCIHHPPQGSLRGTLLYLHPFAEEMNKSRRMAALAARAFAARGWAVLQIDMQGCGDSSGDFAQASWQGWLDDARRGAQWLRERYGRVDAIWGLRAGALLAAEVAAQDTHLLLWQPALSGQQHLNQFLRLKAAADLLAPGGAGGGTKALREQLARGEAVEVAGYALSPALALPLDQAKLRLPDGHAGTVHWLELNTSPASLQFIDSARGQGLRIETQNLEGPAFWQSTEIEEAPALIEASLSALERLHAH